MINTRTCTTYEQAVIGTIATLTCSIISYGNIISDVHFLFQEHNWGVKQGLHVM
jgi:hypothetical protein